MYMKKWCNHIVSKKFESQITLSRSFDESYRNVCFTVVKPINNVEQNKREAVNNVKKEKSL